MLSPSASLRRAAETGHPLPRVGALSELYNRGFDLRQSQMWMLTGRPKAGKSFFAQWLYSEVAKAGRLVDDPCPGLYFFLDGTPFTAGVRQAAWATGHRTQDISAALDGPGATFYEAELAELAEDVTFVFDKKPEMPQIQEAVDAYVELWDRFPRWMVFDNLRNLTGGLENHEEMKAILADLQGLAYVTGANVCVPHHASESGVKDYSRPPRIGDTDGKVSQYPEMVLSVAKDPDSDRFSVAVAAMRDGGASDPQAERPVQLWADLSRVSFTNHRPQPDNAWRQA